MVQLSYRGGRLITQRAIPLVGLHDSSRGGEGVRLYEVSEGRDGHLSCTVSEKKEEADGVVH